MALPPPLVILSLSAAVGYAVGAILIKVALGRGTGAAQVNLYCNLLMAVLMQSIWLFPFEPEWWRHAWKPVVCGATFYSGQYFTFVSLQKGQVSVTTPLLGSKVLFVVLFVSLAGGELLSLRWWLGAGLCSFGILLVSARKGFWREAGGHAAAAMAALLAAASFGLTDALFQFWVAPVGLGAFAPVMFGSMALMSILHLRWQSGCLPPVPERGCRAVAWAGMALLAVQSCLVAIAIGTFHDAAGVNIIYGSRAVLGVLLAGLAARFLWKTGSGELFSTALILRRLGGSILVFAAIVLILLS